MKHLPLLILLVLIPFKAEGHQVIEKQCPECEGMCIPKTGGMVSVTLMACDCCNTASARGRCQITGNSFSYTYQECDEVKWVIDYTKIGVLADTTQQEAKLDPLDSIIVEAGPTPRIAIPTHEYNKEAAWIAESTLIASRPPLDWVLDPGLKPNTKYRVIWHEFVPLVSCKWVYGEWYDFIEYTQDGNNTGVGSRRDSTRVCDTVAFRSTIISYEEVEE